MRYFCCLHDWDDDTARCPTCRTEAQAREAVLRRALAASVSGDVSDICELFTRDVVGSGPATSARSREELAIEIEERRHALAHEEITFKSLATWGGLVRVEWEASGLHVGPLVLESNGAVLEPTGLRLRVRGVTVARFRGQRISSWRSHWEDFALAS